VQKVMVVRTSGGRWYQDEKGRVHTPLEPFVLAATLCLIPVFVLEFDASGGWKQAAFYANWLIWAVFAFELAAILVVARRRAAALRAHWLDVAIVVLTIPIVSAALASLRFARFTRLIRVLRTSTVITRALQAERRLTSTQLFRTVALLTIFLVVIAGVAQAEIDSRDFKSYWDGIWWAVVTVTTIGYGDLYPTSVGGRIVAMVLMMVGIGFLAVLTATIASRFIQTDTGSDEVLDTLRRIEADIARLKARPPS
jgi:voltage-gated potassium channel